jgi:hypothetical protein
VGSLRYLSVPERLGVFGLAAGAAVTVYPAVSRATGVGLPCPLRTLTGIPCPGCGMTTAATGLVAGDIATALAANPFILGLAVLALVAPPLLAARAAGLVGPPVVWSDPARRRVSWAVGLLALVSWSYQLHRFGYL